MADRREFEKSQTSQLKKTEENRYIREQIVEQKQKSTSWKKIGVKLLMLLCASVSAGASFAVVHHMLDYEEEQPETTQSHTISYHEESTQEESSMEDVSETNDIGEGGESTLSQEEWLDQYLEERPYTINDVKDMTQVLYRTYQKIQNAIVTVYVSQEEDTLLHDTARQSETFGIIVSVNSHEAILLVDSQLIPQHATLKAFVGTSLERELPIRQQDTVTGITAVAMSLEDIDIESLQKMKPVVFGNSNKVHIGEPILLAGSPTGFVGSVQYGYISYVQKDVTTVDGQQHVLITDCAQVAYGGGAVFNIEGEMIGWLISTTESAETTGLHRGIGISDLTNIIEDSIIGRNSAYMGILGCTVTEHLASNYGLPKGVYVTGTAAMSPAYYVGIQSGDVIVQINDSVVNNMEDLQRILQTLEEQTEIKVVLQRKGREEYKKRTLILVLEGR